MKTEIINVNGTNYVLEIHYENRNNTKVSIGKKAIYIRVPRCLNREEMFKQVMEMKSWAIKKIQENPERFKQETHNEYKNDDVLKIGDEEYKLSIIFENKQSSSAHITGNLIYLAISSNLSKERQSKHISGLLSRCIARKRLPRLKEKISELNNKHFNQKINKIFFKNTKSRWGSCSELGNINISTRLLFAPDDVLEYVCIHELAHLIEHNHSNNFWTLIEKAMPNYEEKEKWLKENSNKCYF